MLFVMLIWLANHFIAWEGGPSITAAILDVVYVYSLYVYVHITCLYRTHGIGWAHDFAFTFAKAVPICVLKAYQMHLYIKSLGKNLRIGMPFKIYHDIVDNK